MAFKRIYADRVEIVCGECGAPDEHPLTALVAAERMVRFPRCSACKRTSLALNVAPGPITKTGQAAVLQSWIKALHQKLVQSGRIHPEMTEIADLEEFYAGAASWPAGDAVETMVLSGVFAKAHAVWLANQ